MWRGVKEPLLYEGQKSEGSWVFAGEEAAPGTAALFCQCHRAALGLGQPPEHLVTLEGPMNNPVIVERSKPVGGTAFKSEH